MAAIMVGQLTFTFPDGWMVEKYDDWSFYRRRFNGIPPGRKAIDLLAIAPDRTVFLIEVKDYRGHRRTKTLQLSDEVVAKVLDTLAAMLPCKVNGDDGRQIDFSRLVLNGDRLRVILHLEQPTRHSKLFPRNFELANVQDKLRRQMKPVDAHPKVVEKVDLRGLPWEVT